MENIDTKKRTIFKTIGAGIIAVASGAIIRPVLSDPLSIAPAIIAGDILSAITTISNLFSPEKREEINKKITDAKLYHEFRLENSETMDVVMDSNNKNTLTLGLANNVDGFGTDFSIKDGLVYFERRGFSGILNAREVFLSAIIFEKFGIIPIPLEPMANNNLSKEGSNRIRDALGQTMNTDDISLISSRRYSLQSRPKQSEANVEMVAYIDKKLPKINGRQQIKYTYTI